MINTKLSGYLNIARKANALIIGADNLDVYRKKLYLILVASTAGKSTQSIVNKVVKNTGCEKIETSLNLSEILCISNCQVVAIKNKGLAEKIKENIE